MSTNEVEEEAKVDVEASKKSGENDEEAKAFVAEEYSISEARDTDVISGRGRFICCPCCFAKTNDMKLILSFLFKGAAVNLNPGNRKFRDLCFKRKPEFDAASHAAKRRIASEIVAATKAANGRFLKRKAEKGARSLDKGPWYEMTDEQALLKAAQVMRDYQRPDRLAARPNSGNGRKTRRLDDSEEAGPVSFVITVCIRCVGNNKGSDMCCFCLHIVAAAPPC